MTMTLERGPSPVHRLGVRLDPDHLTDGQLLGRYVGERDEVAFAVLVRRHAGLVYGVCRRVLRNAADADDAFQAAFLVLLRKADSLTERATVGDWLYAVAVRVAMKARSLSAKRHRKEATAMNQRAEATPPEPVESLDWFDRELASLPVRYREPVVLCLVQEQSREAAATALGIPEGTLASRLAYAKKWLAERLTRRGMTIPAAFAVTVPAALLDSVSAQALQSTVPEVVNRLATGVMRAMLFNKHRIGVLAAVAGLVLAGGGVMFAGPGERNAKRNAPVPEKKEKEPPEPEWMKEFRKAYQLKDGEYVKRVAPPYIAERVDFSLHGLYAGATVDPKVDGDNRRRAHENALFSTVFVEQDGKKLTCLRSLSSAGLKDMPAKQRGNNLFTVESAISSVTGLGTPDFVIDPKSKDDPLFAEGNLTVHGDFVTRKDAPLEKLAPQLEKILRDECNVDVRLTLKEEEQEVFVVGVKFKLNPPEWRPKKELDIYASEDALNKEYDHFDLQKGLQKVGAVNSSRYGGSVTQFVRFVGWRLGTRMVWDTPLPDEPKFDWHNHTFKNPTKAQEAEDKDPEKVLANVTAQTGLTFKKEKRKVPVLVVSVPEKK